MTARVSAASMPGRAYPNVADGDLYRDFTVRICVPVADDGSHLSDAYLTAAVQRALDASRPTVVPAEAGGALLVPVVEETAWVHPGPVRLMPVGEVPA